jgi:glyoxylase-like metal-dependent hydrolase (beta-lactamase superfamily II)
MNNHTIYRIGEATVTKIPELTLRGFAPGTLFPDLDRTLLSHHPDLVSPGFFDPETGNAILSVHTWLVRTPRHSILIDTGCGNDKSRPSMPMLDHLHEPYLDRLAAAGVESGAIDYVLITHLHADHVGWNTRWLEERWVPTFPHATYVFSALEQKYCAGLTAGDGRVQAVRSESNLGTSVRTPVPGVYADSVAPIVEAGLAKLINIEGSEFVDGLSFHPTPGHSIDHAAISLRSAGHEALFGGDVLHHPLEIYQPDLVSMFCEFPEAARASRQWMLDHAVKSGAIYFSSHFPGTSAGRITGDRGQYKWHSV